MCVSVVKLVVVWLCVGSSTTQDFGGLYDRDKLFWKTVQVCGPSAHCACTAPMLTPVDCYFCIDFSSCTRIHATHTHQDVIICAACAPPGGGRNPVTPRFIRHFSMFCLPSPSAVSLKIIFKVSKDVLYTAHCQPWAM